MSVARVSGGQIVFLNGAWSSGKTSIAQQLMVILRRPYFHLSVDAFNSMRSSAATSELPQVEVAEVLERTVLGFHRAVAGMAEAGNDIVVDHVLREPRWLTDCLAQWQNFDVVFVAVRCSLAELARRERVRGDRRTGQAADQFDRVHAHGGYDVECDTEANHPRDCAMQIKDFLPRRTNRALSTGCAGYGWGPALSTTAGREVDTSDWGPSSEVGLFQVTDPNGVVVELLAGGE